MTELSAVQAAFTAGYAAAGVTTAGYGNTVGAAPPSYEPIAGGTMVVVTAAVPVSAAAQVAAATGDAAASP